MPWIKGMHPYIAEKWKDRDQNPKYYWNRNEDDDKCLFNNHGTNIELKLSDADKCWLCMNDAERKEYIKHILSIFHHGNGCKGYNLRFVEFPEGYTLEFGKFDGANLWGSKIVGVTLWAADFEGAFLNFSRMYDSNYISANFNEAHLLGTIKHLKSTDDFGNCSISTLKRVGEEVSGNYDFAAEVYRDIRNNLRVNGRYVEADKYFYREMICKRKIKKQRAKESWKTHNIKSLWLFTQVFCSWIFVDLYCGYGTKAWRLFTSSLIILFLFSFLYSISLSFFDALKLSSLSLTTMGFGFFQPPDWINYVAPLESGLGIITFAVLVYCFGRKISN